MQKHTTGGRQTTGGCVRRKQKLPPKDNCIKTVPMNRSEICPEAEWRGAKPVRTPR